MTENGRTSDLANFSVVRAHHHALLAQVEGHDQARDEVVLAPRAQIRLVHLHPHQPASQADPVLHHTGWGQGGPKLQKGTKHLLLGNRPAWCCKACTLKATKTCSSRQPHKPGP